jgi:hypothetical protein
MMKVINTRQEIVDKIYEDFGGNKGKHYRQFTTHGIMIFVWTVYSTKCREILPSLIQHLQGKKRQAVLLLQALNIMDGIGRWRTNEQTEQLMRIYVMIRELNRRTEKWNRLL